MINTIINNFVAKFIIIVSRDKNLNKTIMFLPCSITLKLEIIKKTMLLNIYNLESASSRFSVSVIFIKDGWMGKRLLDMELRSCVVADI